MSAPTRLSDIFYLWYQTRLLNGQPLRGDPEGIRCDMEHSALLRRLEEGLELLPEPPPHSYSYPNYAPVDTGMYDPSDVWFGKPGNPAADENSVVIDQTRWTILERGSDEYLVAYDIVDSEKLKQLARVPEHGFSLQKYLEKGFCYPLPRRRASQLYRLHFIGHNERGERRWRLRKV